MKIGKLVKIIIGVVIIIIIVSYFGYRYFNRNNVSGAKNEIQVNSGSTKAVAFSQGISFTLPASYKVNFYSSNSSLIIPSDVAEYDVKNYQETLNKNIIIIQTLTAFNENNEVFEEYVNSRFKSNDKITSEIKFSSINQKRLAEVKLDHKDNDFKETIKVVNLAHPVLVAASRSADKIDTIVQSVQNIQGDDQFIAAKNQLSLIATLLKSNMTDQLYNLISSALKEKASKEQVKDVFSKTENLRQRNIVTFGGLYQEENKIFFTRPIFVNPKDKQDLKSGKIDLVLENGQWLIRQLNLPPDSEE